MAEEFNWLTIVVPIIITGIISVGISLGLKFANKVDKTGEGTLTGTIRLEYVNKGLAEVSQKLDKQSDKLDTLSKEVYNNSWRITELERKTGFKNGATHS